MIDLYTKIVLTVIATCLVVIAFGGHSMDTANAQSGPVHVYVDGVSSFAFQFAGPLKVHAE